MTLFDSSAQRPLRFLSLVLSGLIVAAQAGAWTQTATREKPAEKTARAEKDSATTTLRVEVVAGEKDEPVESASVYVKYTRERTLAKDEKVEMNTKTNRTGIAVLSGVPRGKVVIQVIAPGWKTFGQWYELDKAQHTVRIKLQKPPRWY